MKSEKEIRQYRDDVRLTSKIIMRECESEPLEVQIMAAAAMTKTGVIESVLSWVLGEISDEDANINYMRKTLRKAQSDQN